VTARLLDPPRHSILDARAVRRRTKPLEQSPSVTKVKSHDRNWNDFTVGGWDGASRRPPPADARRSTRGYAPRPDRPDRDAGPRVGVPEGRDLYPGSDSDSGLALDDRSRRGWRARLLVDNELRGAHGSTWGVAAFRGKPQPFSDRSDERIAPRSAALVALRVGFPLARREAREQRPEWRGARRRARRAHAARRRAGVGVVVRRCARRSGATSST